MREELVLPEALVDEITTLLVEVAAAPTISKERARELQEEAKSLVATIRAIRTQRFLDARLNRPLDAELKKIRESERQPADGTATSTNAVARTDG